MRYYKTYGFEDCAYDDPTWNIRMSAYGTLGWTEEGLYDSDVTVREAAEKHFYK